MSKHSTQAFTLPVTPKKRGGQLQDLLAQFDSQSSADSVTKRRRISSVEKANKQDGSPENTQPRRAAHAEADRLNDAHRTIEDLEQTSTELVLKMEKRKREREPTGSVRRSTRERQPRILESDTMVQPPPKSKATPKLDSVRNRLRDDIAQKTKTRANNFLVAHKDYFLPLLPKTNQVAKLVTSHNAQPIVPYKELKEQPEGVTAAMKPYQLSGLSYLAYLHNNGFSGILGDEMGLGKTLQTLSLFQYLEELDRKNSVNSEELRPYLVICPLSVLNSWVTEAQRWVPELKVLRFHGAVNERAHLKKVAMGMEDHKGNETKRAKNRKASRKAGQKVSKTTAKDDSSFKIIVTTYDTFAAEQAWFKHTFVWRYVVLDEGHKIKSSITQISVALRNISSEYRLILTGTPLQNNLVEMWALLAWLYPDVFIDKTETLFKESFDLNKGKVNRQTMDDARRLLEIIMLRRMKDSPGVNLGLPPKEEILLYVPLTPMQRFWYTRLLTRVDNAMLKELFEDGREKEKAAIKQDKHEDELLHRMHKLQSGDADKDTEWAETTDIMRKAVEKENNNSEIKSAWQKLMNLVMQLRKCCSHPYLLPGVEPEPYYLGEHIIRASGKFILLEKLLNHTVFEQGKKVLIFSGFTRTLDYTEDLLALISEGGTRFKHLRLDGSTARAKRNLDIRLFNQETSEYKVMLLSTRAGGLGINLTSAQDVIFLDEDWNPQITLQAEARAHRIGQTKKVTIYKLCTQGTVEEQMMGRIRKKLYLSAKITESMRNIHGEQAEIEGKKSKGRQSLSDDVPHMNTSQLKTLIRRGAQTLSHPDIDVNEMVSWDLDTMMDKCRDKPMESTDASISQSEADEEKWLGMMERVETAVFDGKRVQRERGPKTNNAILPDTITRQDRRKGKNTTVLVDGYHVAKESMNCGEWEAVPTFAGKDPRLADPVREKRREINHQGHCISCSTGPDTGDMVVCRGCPRSYHFDCLDKSYQAKVSGLSGFYCSQHRCGECDKSTSDAGGLIFRCRWCPMGYCEDCLEWDHTELIGENLVEFELLGEGPTTGGFYIKCPSCVENSETDPELKKWMAESAEDYEREYQMMMETRAEEIRKFEQAEKEAAAAAAKKELKKEEDNETDEDEVPPFRTHLPILTSSPAKRASYVVIDDEDDKDVASPPALTDSSLPTPAIVGSRVGTPVDSEVLPKSNSKKRAGEGEKLGRGKKARA